MEPFIPERILWPHGPLRVLFSVLAVLSAVCLYFVTPRFAESPSLFATAVLILFVAEVTAFEVGVRHLKVSAAKNAQLAGALREEGDVLAERARHLFPQRVAEGRVGKLSLLSEKIRSAKHFALFAEVTPAEFEVIIGTAREKHFERRETIFTEGDPVRQVTILLSGVVKVIQRGLSGNEVILSLSCAGEMVGSVRLRGDYTHSSTAQAVQPCIALIWDTGVFEKLLAQIPTFRRNIVRALEERLLEMEQRFREVSTEKIGSRLNSEVVRLSDRLRRTENGHLETTLSRAELAQLTGTTLFTINRLLNQWRMEGIETQREETVVLQYISALNDFAVNV